jgi:ribose-phosphate pyrophosphokinase
VRAQSGNGVAAEEAPGAAAASNGRLARPILAPPSWDTAVRSAPQLFPRERHSSLPNRLRLFAGTSNPALAQEVTCYLGLELGKMKIKRFADGEIYVQVG